MSLEILKLNKQVETAMTDAGFTSPKEIQAKTMSRIMGGQDLIAVSPENSGKTTALILGVLMRLKYGEEHPPRALILVPTREKVTLLTDQFRMLGKRTGLKVLPLVSGAGIEGQREALLEGTDIVVGTPDRILTLYQKSALNLNKLKMFILDDADQLIKQGFQTPIHLLHESLPRCQRLVFTEVIHTKLHRLADPILNYPTIIEAKDASEDILPITPTQLYQVPNYKTKLNLLNLLMREADIFTKVIVFANSAHTVEKLYKSLNRRITGEVAILKPSPAEAVKLDSPEDFLQAEELRVLIVNNEKTDTPIPVTEVPYTLHFDIPAEKEILLERIKIQEDEEADQRLSIIFSTDHDLALVKKAEAETGQEFTVEELPFDLIVEGDPHSKKDDDEEEDDDNDKKGNGGGAFHEKKASNAKTYNYKYKDRLKMFGKKHRRHKRGE